MPSDASSRQPVRARARRALRAEITGQALALFSERGFDAVTADELAEAVGVSRRTLFRLFATKEDIVVAAFDNLGDEALAALRERPADEPPWTALRHALGAAAAKLEERPATFFELHGVIAQTPALRRRLLEQRDGWRAAFAEELAARSPPRGTSSLASCWPPRPSAPSTWQPRCGRGPAGADGSAGFSTTRSSCSVQALADTDQPPLRRRVTRTRRAHRHRSR